MGGGGGGTISAEGGQYLLADYVRGGQFPLADYVRGGQNLRGDRICSDTGSKKVCWRGRETNNQLCVALYMA